MENTLHDNHIMTSTTVGVRKKGRWSVDKSLKRKYLYYTKE
jgi:hypothetical protein